jgi:ankyrin repeat protein
MDIEHFCNSIENYDIRVFNWMLKSGIDINSNNVYGVSPLHVASGCGSLYMTSAILKEGANVNALSNNYIVGANALHFACRVPKKNASLRVCQLLIDHGINVNAQRSNGLTPLHIACQNGHDKICQLFLENGAKPNISSKNDGIELPHINIKSLDKDMFKSTLPL